jgi:hypothetical protein
MRVTGRNVLPAKRSPAKAGREVGRLRFETLLTFGAILFRDTRLPQIMRHHQHRDARPEGDFPSWYLQLA